MENHKKATYDMNNSLKQASTFIKAIKMWNSAGLALVVFSLSGSLTEATSP